MIRVFPGVDNLTGTREIDMKSFELGLGMEFAINKAISVILINSDQNDYFSELTLKHH